MTRSILFLSLISLISCTGGSDCSEDCDNSEAVRSEDDTQCCSTTDDTATQAELAEIVVNSTFQDDIESCEVIIGNLTVGNTGETILIAPNIPTEVEVGILDGPRTTDGLPLHTLGPLWDETVWAGASVVTPKQTVTGSLTAPQTVTAGFNLWQKDTWWTCNAVRSWDGGSDPFTAMTAYRNGETFSLPFIGKAKVNGINFQIDSSFTGQFISPTEATAVWQQSDTAYVTVTCFTSNQNGERVDVDGNIVE